MLSKETSDLITKYLSGNCSDDERNLLLSKIKSDPVIKAEYEKLQEIWDFSDDYGDTAAVDLNEAMAKFKAKASTIKPHRQPFGSYPMFKIAAMLIIVIGVSFILKYSLDMASNPTVAYDEVITDKKEKSFVQLVDSSTVWLNQLSSISYPEKFAEDQRQITVHGEVFVEVTRDEKKPFVVTVNKLKIEVLGTSFNVREYQDSIVEVTVFSGKVQLSDISANGTEFLILEKGDMGIYDLRNDTYLKMANTNPNVLAWKNEVLNFDATPLKMVQFNIERYFDIRMTMNDELLNCDFSGSFKNPQLEEVIKMLSISMNANYRIKDNQVILENGSCL